MKKPIFLIAAVLLCMSTVVGCSLQLNPYSLQSIALKPLQAGPVSFGDFIYDIPLKRLIAPAASVGNLLLIDPTTDSAQQIPGFSQQSGGLAAAAGGGSIFALDHTANTLVVVDPSAGKISSSVPLQAPGDDISYVPATNEVWVAEKQGSQIEVFQLGENTPPQPQSSGVIKLESGPESLLVNNSHGLVFVSLPDTGQTVVINQNTHGVIQTWENGCNHARGMAIDEDTGYLFVACEEGRLVVLDAYNDGSQIGSQTYGGELREIAYNKQLKHLYLPSGKSAILAVFEVSRTVPNTPTPGNDNASAESSNQAEVRTNARNTIFLNRIGTADTAVGANCIASDQDKTIWVCDPKHGQILKIEDTFPASNDS